MKEFLYWPAHLTLVGLLAAVMALVWFGHRYPHAFMLGVGIIVAGALYLLFYTALYDMYMDRRSRRKGEEND